MPKDKLYKYRVFINDEPEGVVVEAKNDYNARMDVLNQRRLSYADNKTRVVPLYRGRKSPLAPITVAPAPPPMPRKPTRFQWLMAMMPLLIRHPGTGRSEGPLT